MTKITADRILAISEQNKMLLNEQAGFRKLEECSSHVTSLYEIAIRRGLQGRSKCVSFLDFSKAHDRVPGLFAK